MTLYLYICYKGTFSWLGKTNALFGLTMRRGPFLSIFEKVNVSLLLLGKLFMWMNKIRNNLSLSLSSAMEIMFHSSSFLLPSIPADETRYALVVLNQNLPRFTPLLWEHGTCSSFFVRNLTLFWELGLFICFEFLCRTAKLRLCADGGANRIYDELPLFFPLEDAFDIRNRLGFGALW